MAKESTPQVRSGRTKRTPINGRNVLTVSNKEPGYEYRFVNDEGDRVALFQENGWELVEAADVKIGDRRLTAAGPLGSKAQASVDKTGKKAFVMRIKKEWYDEDQLAKQQAVADVEKSMKQSALSKNDYGTIEITRS